jgi:maleate cis-trans isomerase
VTTSAPVIGLLYPGSSAEDDFSAHERRHAGAVRLPLVHTTVGEDAHRVDALLDLGSDERLAEGAREIAGDDPDVVLWACTSGSFVFGWDGAHAQARALAAASGRPASSTSLAFVRAVAALGLGRVAVAASYPADVAALFAAFLRRGGTDVVSMTSRGIVTAAEVGTVGEDALAAMVRDADRPDADAVLVPDTALHTLALLDDLEAAVGKPVLTANQVTVWEGLRLCGAAGGAATRACGLGVLSRA